MDFLEWDNIPKHVKGRNGVAVLKTENYSNILITRKKVNNFQHFGPFQKSKLSS